MGLDVLQEDADGKNALELCTNEGRMQVPIFLTKVEVRSQMITLAKSFSKTRPSDMDI